jgi:primosomal protein N' (replication factor Y) (superfamily II helicase)
MKIVTVIPLKRGPLKDHLTYFTSKNVENGDIVVISVRAQKILALVIDTEDASTNKTIIKDLNFNLKKILEIQKNNLFDKDFINTSLHLSSYFVSSKNNIIANLIPKVLLENFERLNELAKTKNQKEIISKTKNEKYIFQSPLQDRLNIYKNLIRESLKKGQSLFITAPTEVNLKFLFKELSKGIEKEAFLIHGKMPSGKQYQVCQEILTSNTPILIIGTAPFLAINRKDIKTIIIENESSPSYKMLRSPFVDLAVFIESLAENKNQKIILADNLLSFKTIQNKKEYTELYPLSFDLDFPGEVKIQNKKNIEETSKEYKIFSQEIINTIKKNIDQDKKIFIFTLRKGLATETICKDCKTSILCDDCHAPIVLYSSASGTKRIYVCNKCKKQKETDLNCPKCDSWNLLPLGIGTDTVYEEIKRNFPDKDVYKIDKENVKSKKELLEIITNFTNNKKGSILIGTELALMYLNSKSDLSIVSSFDSLWSIPNYKMSEKILQILNTIATKTKDEIIIQTKNISDNALIAIQNKNIFHFIRKELEIRKELSYPPFKTFIKIKYLSKKEDCKKIKDFLENYLREYEPDVFNAFISKIKNQYITNALIRIDNQKWNTKNTDSKLFEKLNALPKEFIIQTNPEDII